MDRRTAVAVPSPNVGDVRLGHRPCLDRIVGESGDRQMLGTQRGLPADQVRAVQPVVGKLDACQRTAVVNLVRDARDRREILVVPESEFDEGPDVRRRVDLDLFGADHSPAALGLDLTHVRLARRIAVSHAVAVRHLIETVSRGDRADLHGFEEDVVAGVAHWVAPAFVGLPVIVVSSLTWVN